MIYDPLLIVLGSNDWQRTVELLAQYPWHELIYISTAKLAGLS
jgi:hypothetical protein